MRFVSDHLHRTQLNHEQPFIVNKDPRHIQNTHNVKVTEGKEGSKEKKKKDSIDKIKRKNNEDLTKSKGSL